MWWTSDSNQSLIILCLGKYLSESFETFKAKTKRHYAKDIWKIGCHSDDSNDVSPRPLQWLSQNEAWLSSHSSESTGILEPKGKTDFLIAV